MTILSARSFLSRSLTPAKLITERCFSNNKCRMKKPIFQDSQIGIVWRKYSSDSFPEFRGQISDSVGANAFNLAEKLFTSFHDLTGLPWWCVIASSAFILKISFLPCSIFQSKIHDKYDLVMKQMPVIQEKVSYEVNAKRKFYNWSPEITRRKYLWMMFTERRKLLIENNCSPLRAIFISFLEIPGWIFVSLMWRRFSKGLTSDNTTSDTLLSQMRAEGPIWCSDITNPDPYYIIPALVLVCRLCNIQLSKDNYDMLYKQKSKMYEILIHVSRVFAIVISLCSSILPASVSLFWLFMAIFNFCNILLMSVPKVRQYFGLSWRNVSHRDLLRRLKSNILTLLRIKKKGV